MTSTFKTFLLAGAAALVVALGGAVAAQAGGYGHSGYSALLLSGAGDDDTYADSESDPITEAVEAAATAAAVDALLGGDSDED